MPAEGRFGIAGSCGSFLPSARLQIPCPGPCRRFVITKLQRKWLTSNGTRFALIGWEHLLDPHDGPLGPGKGTVSVSAATATRTCRILYYGPQDVGKRENLRLIHSSVPPENRLSLATGDPERQIAFRFANESQGNWQVLVQCVDTGKERYRSAGMSDQPPFDGVVFVISSRAGLLDQGMAAMESLKTYLDTWGLDLLEVPLVIQYNGREKPDILPVDKLESLINPWSLLSFPGSTQRHEGVKETLKAILGLTVNHLRTNPRHPEAGTGMELKTEPRPEPPPEDEQDAGLVLEYGPPVPGSELEGETLKRSEAIFDELRPPIVIPVRIPSRLLSGSGPVRILLEVEIDDNGDY